MQPQCSLSWICVVATYPSIPASYSLNKANKCKSTVPAECLDSCTPDKHIHQASTYSLQHLHRTPNAHICNISTFTVIMNVINTKHHSNSIYFTGCHKLEPHSS